MNNLFNISDLKKMASQIRRDVLRMVHSSQSGHPGGSLGCADFFTCLYFNLMLHDNRFNLDGEDEDVFFLSNGHISPVWYSTLARSGYFSINELKSFRQIDSRLQGHPAVKEGLPGIRIASGSLGQGLSVALGVCQAKKMNNDDKLVYVLMGDGELNEGQVWEAAMYANHYQIDNIIATIDYNQQQIDGTTNQVMSLGNLKDKWQAFGWHVIESDGNNLEDLLKKIKQAKSYCFKKQPIMNIMKTDMGYGVDFMQGTNEWHGIAPNDEQLRLGLAQLEETFGDY